jgi:hypothetical protein
MYDANGEEIGLDVHEERAWWDDPAETEKEQAKTKGGIFSKRGWRSGGSSSSKKERGEFEPSDLRFRGNADAKNTARKSHGREDSNGTSIFSRFKPSTRVRANDSSSSDSSSGFPSQQQPPLQYNFPKPSVLDRPSSAGLSATTLDDDVLFSDRGSAIPSILRTGGNDGDDATSVDQYAGTRRPQQRQHTDDEEDDKGILEQHAKLLTLRVVSPRPLGFLLLASTFAVLYCVCMCVCVCVRAFVCVRARACARQRISWIPYQC